MKRLPSLPSRVLVALTALLCCSENREHSKASEPSPQSTKAEAQARGFANANAMVDNAKLCEPESGAPSLVACQKACELNHSNSCSNWAALVEADDEQAALQLHQRACKGGSGIGCEGNARLVAKRGGESSRIYLNARRYHRIHCSQDYARSCEQLAALLETTNGGEAEPETAASFRQRACTLGRKSSCTP